MLRSDLLKGLITQRGLSQRKLAPAIGITEKTFYSLMKSGRFNREHIEEISRLLHMTEAQLVTIFFYRGSDGP